MVHANLEYAKRFRWNAQGSTRLSSSQTCPDLLALGCVTMGTLGLHPRRNGRKAVVRNRGSFATRVPRLRRAGYSRTGVLLADAPSQAALVGPDQDVGCPVVSGICVLPVRHR